MKHTRRKTLTKNIFARLKPIKNLNNNPGKIDRHKSPKNRSARRKGSRVCHRNDIPQKVMDYYGFVSIIETDMWDIDFRDRRYIGRIHNDDPRWSVGWKCIAKDYHPKVRKISKQKRKRNLRRFVKKYGLEHKLLHS